MKKIVFRITLFLMSFVGIYIMAIFFIVKLKLDTRISNIRLPYEKNKATGTTRKFLELEEKKDLDVLFVGSSHTYHTFDTRFYEQKGLSVMNIGTVRQTPLNTYAILSSYLKKNRPKVIVMETYWKMFEKDIYIESSYDLILNTKLTMPLFQNTLLTTRISLINTFLAEYFRRNNGDILKHRIFEDEEGRKYIKGGFSETLNNEIPNLTSLQKHSEFFEFDWKQLYYLEKIIQLSHDKNVKILLVRTPVSMEYKNTISNYQETVSKIQNIAIKHQVNFIDFNSTNYQWNSNSDFSDKNHLNQYGVEKFNPIFYQHLIKYIKNEQ